MLLFVNISHWWKANVLFCGSRQFLRKQLCTCAQEAGMQTQFKQALSTLYHFCSLIGTEQWKKSVPSTSNLDKNLNIDTGTVG